MDGLKSLKQIKVTALRDHWVASEYGAVPSPWSNAPLIGNTRVKALMVLTANYLLVELPSYKDFYRLMIRGGDLKLVLTNGEELLILEAYIPVEVESTSFRLFGSITGPEKALTSNLLDFKKK